SVTVCLSGDGGDELFAGYPRYSFGNDLWGTIGKVPRSLRNLASRCLRSLSPTLWTRLLSTMSPLLPSKFLQQHQGEKAHKLAEILMADTHEAMYLALISHWKQPTSVVIDSSEPVTIVTDSARWMHLPTFSQRMMYLDAVTYLPDDILVKVDRASMGVGLET